MEKTYVYVFLKKIPFHFIYLIVNIAFKEKGPKIFSYAIDASRHPYLLRSKYRKIIRKGIFKSISIYLVPCCPRYKIIQSVYHGKCWSISKYINFLNNTGDILGNYSKCVSSLKINAHLRGKEMYMYSKTINISLKSQNKTLVNKLQHVVFQLIFKKMKNNERQFSIFITVLNLAFAIDCYC